MPDAFARPVDRAVGGYLILAGPALLFPHRPAAWPILALLHVLVGAFLVSGRLDPVRRFAAGPGPRPAGRRVAAFLADWYPLLLMPAMYSETQLLNRSVWDGRYFDPVIMAWEAAVFGGQPSVTLAMRWDWLALSELLHLAYLSFYLVVYVLPIWLYVTGRTDAFRKTVFALMLGFVAHYLVFIYFPVQGPRYIFPGPAGAPTEGFLYGLTRSVLESGSSQGAAFPSSHVALAAVQTGNALRYAPRVAPLLAVLTLGIALGAVYGGFHYAIDASVGLAAGAAVAALAPAAWNAVR